MALIELDDDTVRRIAAGEVVERPASAVKELVENSLDAVANRVTVEVAAGGKDRIAVSDDGIGMTRAEARLAVQEHTTSKIDTAADLTAGISTLGFRGEALYAIGAVSTMTVTTRPRDGEEATRVRVEQGEILDVGPAGRGPGTTVEVTDLFSGMPAREKFLATDATEFDHVNRIVSRYAIAKPEVAMSLHHDGREVFTTPGQGSLDGTLLAVYGREVAESMRPVNGDGVSGAVSHPEVTRSTREYVSTFVNGRYVPSSELRGAIVEAYGRQLAPDRYPFAAVFVDVDPDAVDVNVHPRKLEVRFDDPAAVRDRVRSAVQAALLEEGLLRSGAPRGKSAPAEVDPRPEPAVESVPTDESPASGQSGTPDRGRPDDTDHPMDAKETGAPEPPTWHPTHRIRDEGTQTTLDTETANSKSGHDHLPPLTVLGQLEETYVVCAADRGLVLVDQHAADERVNYERLASALADDPGVQTLADPVELELTAREAELFPAFLPALESVGFRAEQVDERTVSVTAVPAVLEGALDAGLLRDVLPELAREDAAVSVEARADAVIADLACHPAVTGHTSLTEGSIRQLLEALDDCENPYACPHGRPTMIEVSAEELADRFERDYPGHAERREEA
ncbi:MAG: DNA mismatch repair endonuclease MutL [Halobacteriales archaeon]